MVVRKRLEKEMTKKESIEILKLLSALESWAFATGQRPPDYLMDSIESAVKQLTNEILKEGE